MDGLLGAVDLIWGLKQQVREIVLALFELDSGTFRFEQCDLSGENIVKVHLKMDDLIEQGAQLSQSPDAIEKTGDARL